MFAFAQEAQEVTVDESEEDIVWAIWRANGTIQTCIRIILDRLLAGGIDILNEKNEKISPVFKEQVIDKYYKPFIAKLISYLIIFGYACIQIVPEDGHLIPVVLDFGTYQVRFVDEPNKARQYYCYRTNQMNSFMDKPDPNIIVVVEDHPTHQGFLTSRLSALLRRQQFVMSLENFAIVAEVGRSKPLIMTETREAGNLGVVDARNQIFYSPADSEIVKTNKRIEQSLVTARATKFAQKMVDKLNRGFMYDSSFRDPATGIPLLQGSKGRAWQRNVYPLAPDQKLVNQLLPQIRNDLVDQNREAKAEVCGVLGVPLTIFSPEGGGQQHAANAEQTAATLEGTVRHWKMVGIPIIRDVYHAIYDPEDQDYYRALRISVAKRRKVTEKTKRDYDVQKASGKRVNQSDQYAAHWDQKAIAQLAPPQIKVVFGGVIDPMTLRTMYENGEIEAEMFRMYMARAYGVPEETFRLPPKPEIEWRRQMEEKQLKLQEKQFELSVKVADDQAKQAQEATRVAAQSKGVKVAKPKSKTTGASSKPSTSSSGSKGEKKKSKSQSSKGASTSGTPAKKTKKTQATKDTATSSEKRKGQKKGASTGAGLKSKVNSKE